MNERIGTGTDLDPFQLIEREGITTFINQKNGDRVSMLHFIYVCSRLLNTQRGPIKVLMKRELVSLYMLVLYASNRSSVQHRIHRSLHDRHHQRDRGLINSEITHCCNRSCRRWGSLERHPTTQVHIPLWWFAVAIDWPTIARLYIGCSMDGVKCIKHDWIYPLKRDS